MNNVDMAKIRRAVRRARELMPSGFDLRELQSNDPDHDWEFRQVERLAEKHGKVGLYISEWPLITIYWDADLPPDEVMLTVAHELGHHFLHSVQGKTVANSQSESNLMELEAEVFSHELLAGH